MQVRVWQEKDLPVIAEMEKRCFSDPWTEKMITDSFKIPIYHGFVAEEGGHVCGYTIVTVLFEDAEVMNVAVDIPFRGRGISKLLMNEMHKVARNLGAVQSFLEVRVSNVTAIGLYKSYGYETYGVRAKYYEDGEDAFVMKKDL